MRVTKRGSVVSLDLGQVAVLWSQYVKQTQLAESLALAELIDEHGLALYCDFRRFYGLDLAAEIAVTWPVLLLTLVEGLPEESAFVGSVRGGGPAAGWTRMHGLLADLNDQVQVNTLATGQFKRRPRFQPYPRPAARPSRVTVAGMRRQFGRG